MIAWIDFTIFATLLSFFVYALPNFWGTYIFAIFVGIDAVLIVSYRIELSSDDIISEYGFLRKIRTFSLNDIQSIPRVWMSRKNLYIFGPGYEFTLDKNPLAVLYGSSLFSYFMSSTPSIFPFPACAMQKELFSDVILRRPNIPTPGFKKPD